MKLVQIKIVYFGILLVAFSEYFMLTFSSCLHACLLWGSQNFTSVLHEWVLGSEYARLIGI